MQIVIVMLITTVTMEYAVSSTEVLRRKKVVHTVGISLG